MSPRNHFDRLRFAVAALLLAATGFACAQLAPTNPWEADIRAFEQADRQDPPKAGGVLFIGSSSIRFWESLPADFPGVPIIRRGFGGSEIRDATHFVDRIVIPYHPRLIVFYAGDNDLAAGRTPLQVRDDFAAFVERVRRGLPSVAIAYLAIKPSPARSNLLGAMREANTLIGEVARSGNNLRIVDVFHPMLDANGQPRAELFGPDQLHMNRAGYRIWIEVLAPILRASDNG